MIKYVLLLFILSSCASTTKHCISTLDSIYDDYIEFCAE